MKITCDRCGHELNNSCALKINDDTESFGCVCTECAEILHKEHGGEWGCESCDKAFEKKAKPRTARQGIKEKSVIKAVDEYLAWKQIPHWRMNSGALSTERGQFVRFGAKGMSDFYAIGPDGVSIWIECKRPQGGRLSEAQEDFLNCIRKNGGIAIVANSVETLELQLIAGGVIK